MMNVSKKGDSFKLRVVKIKEDEVLLQDCKSNDELTVSKNQLRHFGSIEVGMVLNTFIHADYNGSDKVYIYPDRNSSQPVKADIEDNVKMNVLEGLSEFDLASLEKVATVISKGYKTPEELAAAAGVTLWRPESSTLEYKTGCNFEEISQTIVAFFNSDGGTLYLGISDLLEVIGLEANGLTTDQMRRGIINNLRQTTSGTMIFNRIQIVFDHVQGHLIAKITVPSHQGMEVAYHKHSLVVRFDCTTHRLEGEEHTQWIIQRYKNTYMQTNNSLAV